MWFSIGSQFSSDIYGLLAPGRSNLAAHLARRLAAINGHAEGLDGGVFVAGMVSLAFVESDPRRVVSRYLDGDTLVTWPEDEARGLLLRRTIIPHPGSTLTLEVSADPNRHWQLEIYSGNQRLLAKTVDENWQTIAVPLPASARPLDLRLYQRVNLTGNLIPGSARWRRLRLTAAE